MKDKVSVVWIGNGEYILSEPLDVNLAGITVFTIPRGFRTDFASVPSFLHWFIDKDDDTVLIPALVHDFLYGVSEASKFIADAVFYELMKQYGAGWKAIPAYIAVRIFGEKTVDN